MQLLMSIALALCVVVAISAMSLMRSEDRSANELIHGVVFFVSTTLLVFYVACMAIIYLWSVKPS